MTATTSREQNEGEATFDMQPSFNRNKTITRLGAIATTYTLSVAGAARSIEKYS